jgi:hypothetical protein
MRTIFALFEGYREAGRAVEELASKGFDTGDLNLIAQIDPRELNLIVQEPTTGKNIDAGMGGRPEEEQAAGIDRLVAGRQSVVVPDVGNVVAVGNAAAMMVETASSDPSPSGLRDALVGFDVPDEMAGFYRDGVSDGGVLLWMRTDDTRATELANVLSSAKEEEMVN